MTSEMHVDALDAVPGGGDGSEAWEVSTPATVLARPESGADRGSSLRESLRGRQEGAGQVDEMVEGGGGGVPVTLH